MLIVPVGGQVAGKCDPAKDQEEDQGDEQELTFPRFQMGDRGQDSRPAAGGATHVVANRVHDGEDPVSHTPLFPVQVVPASGTNRFLAPWRLHQSATLADCECDEKTYYPPGVGGPIARCYVLAR